MFRPYRIKDRDYQETVKLFDKDLWDYVSVLDTRRVNEKSYNGNLGNSSNGSLAF